MALSRIDPLISFQLSCRNISGTDLRVLKVRVFVVIYRIVLSLLSLKVLIVMMAVWVKAIVFLIFKIISVLNSHENVHVIIDQELELYSLWKFLVSLLCKVRVINHELFSLLFAVCLGNVVFHMVEDVNVFDMLHPKDCQLQNRHF